MPAKKSSEMTALGRAIIKSREKHPTARRSKKASEDGDSAGYVSYKSKEKVAKSIVEENDLDEFLAKADLAGTNFEAEHMNVKFISIDDNKLIELGKKNQRTVEEAQEKLRDRLRIPRRPQWSPDMTAQELQTIENKSFLEWRRELAALELEEHVLLTPFERNLEVWRQLWRVIERSDIVVQIVDARNPLLYRCHDLEKYVKEVGDDKVNFILVNKADLLTPKQIREWAQYFRKEGIFAAFWSAATTDDNWSQKSTEESTGSRKEDTDEEDDADAGNDAAEPESFSNADKNDDESKSHSVTDDEDLGVSNEDEAVATAALALSGITSNQDGVIVNRDTLMDLLRSLRPDKTDEKIVVGMVGYPNVGKSSTINKLIGQKKVAVSATPGKTKHFQTLNIDEKFCLCDCPGLVMPSFVVSKEEMIASGILPCDEMRDSTPAVALICSRIDRKLFERHYGLMLPKPGEFDDPNRPPTPKELLTAYAFLRGFMSSKGIPDSSRAARIIIKDFVNGRLLYCHAPPGVDQSIYNDANEAAIPRAVQEHRSEMLAVLQRRNLLDEKPKTADIDQKFFSGASSTVHIKSAKKSSAGPGSNKKHHNNRNKKEKLRRVYGYLDA